MAFPRLRRRSSTRIKDREQELYPTYNLEWNTLQGFLEDVYPGWTSWNERRVSAVPKWVSLGALGC